MIWWKRAVRPTTCFSAAVFKPLKFGITLLSLLAESYPKEFKFRNKRINQLFGKKYLAEMLKQGETADSIISKWQNEIKEFKLLRNKCLIY